MKIKAILTMLIMLGGACMYALPDTADAARLGGGRSFGSRPSMSQPAQAPSAMQRQSTQQRQQAAQAQQPQRKGFLGGMGGLLGGLLAGSLIGSLLFGGGFSGGGIMDILLLEALPFRIEARAGLGDELVEAGLVDGHIGAPGLGIQVQAFFHVAQQVTALGLGSPVDETGPGIVPQHGEELRHVHGLGGMFSGTHQADEHVHLRIERRRGGLGGSLGLVLLTGGFGRGLFAAVGVVGIFNGDSWANAFFGNHVGGIFSAIILIITFLLVDMFDTIGTLYGTATEADMLDEKGDPIDINKAMLCDSIATVGGAVMGTSTCTTFVESSAGVAQGGKTGLTSLVVAICFLLCLFLSPLASIIPSCATAPALMYVGVLMVKNFGNVDMSDIRSAVPAFLALIMMPLTYSIANGIGIASIAYVLITLFTGNYKKRDIMVTIIAILFIFKFITVTM